MTSSLLASRTTRRRGIAFATLTAACLVLMALSGTPAMRELRNGITFAFQPALKTLDGVGGAVASVFSALAEMDTLRLDNTQLRDENDRLRVENARLE